MKKGYLQLLFLSVIFLWFTGCQEPIDPKSIDYDDLLVVEGMVTHQLQRQRIKLSRTYPLDGTKARPETGAEVNVTVDDGETHLFIEQSPGIYLSEQPFSAVFGNQYQLMIRTSNGSEYISNEVEMTATPEIDSLYAQFVAKPSRGRGAGDFNFFLHVEENETQTRFFRWQWVETYRLRVPNPSRLRWLGGDEFEYRDEAIPEDQEENCFKSDANQTIILAESRLTSGQILRFPIHSFGTESKKMNIRYSLEVTQYGMSAEANEYWKAIAEGSQNTGSLFDKQPGTIVGNMRSVDDNDEIVLGIFEVSQERKRRIYYRASDFYDKGFSLASQYWLECGIDPILVSFDEAGSFMEENQESHVLLYYSTGVGAVFGIKKCALCTLYGTNEVPEFWED